VYSIQGSELTELWATLALLLVLSRTLARLAQRIGAPPIVGALVAGVLLSPDLLGGTWPAAAHWLFPETQLAGHLLGGITNLALLFLCFVLGIETDIGALRNLGGQLTIVTSTTFVLPLAAGIGLGAVAPASFIGADGNRASLVVLTGAALAVSSLPVIAWMLRELGLYDSTVGRISVGVSTIQDALGFVLLSVGIAFAGSGGQLRLIEVGIGLFVVLLLALVGGAQRTADFVLHRADPERIAPSSAVLTVMIASMLLIAALTQFAHFAGAFGAFLVGVVFGRSPYHRHDAAHILDTITIAVFAPIYFAAAGLQLNLGLFRYRDDLVGLVLVVIVGAVAKVAGTLVGAPWLHQSRRNVASIASVLNGRGTMQIIIASVALRHSVIGPSAFTIIVTASLLTSLVAAPLTRIVAGKRSVFAADAAVAVSGAIRGTEVVGH
jgi:Kef-type K+ transport system membrane component KefB